MTYIDRASSKAQEPTSKKTSGPNGASASKPSNVVTDFISREQWKAAFRAVALANDYTKTEILLAGALADNFYCKTGKCDPGFEKLAAQINAGLRTVKLAAKTLEADGWCIRTRGGRTDKVNFTLCMPNLISAAMPALMEDVTDVSNADSISAENGHFSGSISANTAAPLNTEVEQRRAGLGRAGLGPRSSDDESQSPACNTDISNTTSAPDRRLCSDRVEKDHAETHGLEASCYPIGFAVANAANAIIDRIGHAARRPDNQPPPNEVSKMARIARTREQMFANFKNMYPIVGLDDETNFAAFELALDHGYTPVELMMDVIDQKGFAKDGRDVPDFAEFMVRKCWSEAIAA